MPYSMTENSPWAECPRCERIAKDVHRPRNTLDASVWIGPSLGVDHAQVSVGNQRIRRPKIDLEEPHLRDFRARPSQLGPSHQVFR